MTNEMLKPIGEFLHREPNAEQAEMLGDVLELARAYERGELGLDSLRRQCTGLERFQAMRYVAPESEDERLLHRLVASLVADDEAEGRGAPQAGLDFGTARVMMHSENADAALGQGNIAIDAKLLGDAGYMQTTNYRGVRVWVSPLCWIHGEPIYPPVNLPPGEERRLVEAAIQHRYEAYRRDRKRGPVGTKREESEDA